MAEILKGIAVARKINDESVSLIREYGLKPVLALIRVGEKESDLAYERNIIKKCGELGIEIKIIQYNDNVKEEILLSKIGELNSNDAVSAIMMFRPLPEHLDTDRIANTISPKKDVDGSTIMSLSGLFADKSIGFTPCTAEAVIRMLDFYNTDIEGKDIVVIGRSLVIGKPVSMLLLRRNATVTMCHSKTKNLKDIVKNADIVIAAIGKAEYLGKDYFSSGQTVIDVGMNYSKEKSKLVGDVKFDEVSEIVDRISPVPGGVGSVTTSVLLNHIVKASKK